MPTTELPEPKRIAAEPARSVERPGSHSATRLTMIAMTCKNGH
jgi:hypothetical protein